MPISITLDLDAGFSFESSSIQARWDRPYLATDVTEDTVAAMLSEITQALPQQGDKAPDPWNLICINRTVDKIWKAEESGLIYARGLVQYSFGSPTSQPPPIDNNGPGTTLSVTSFTEEIETATDRLGNPIQVQDSDGLTRGEEITVPMSRARINFSRKEVDFPSNRQTTYTNAINSALWNGYAAGTVRCESIAADTTNDGQDYIVVYTFIYRQEGWNGQRVVGRDLLTGKPIAAPSGAEEVFIDSYTPQNFSLLNITIP